MATTKKTIAEEILRVLNGGNIPSGSKFHELEIMKAVEQVGNQVLKMEFMNTAIPMGDFIPSGAAIATYESVEVVKYLNKSKSTLPAFPIKLPRNIGVYQIFDPADPYNEFIPIELGLASLMKDDPVLSDLSGNIGYEVAGMDIVYNKDITVTNELAAVTMRLVVLDFSKYSEYDILPLNPEYEWQIKNEVIRLFGGELTADKLVDPGVKEQRGVPVNKQNQS